MTAACRRHGCDGKVLAGRGLGLGIGVNTAIFGVINSVLLRQMPVADPGRLIVVSRGERTAWSYPDSRDFWDRSRTLSGLAGSWPMESDLDVEGDSAFVGAEVVTADYGEVLGVKLVLGRWFADEREPFAVISHAAWERWFHRSPNVLGRRVRSQSASYTVVGVAPPEFIGALAPVRTDIWVPLGTVRGVAERLEDGDGGHLFMLFRRLRAGATATEASNELNAIDAQLRVEHGRPSESALPISADEASGHHRHEGRRRTVRGLGERSRSARPAGVSPGRSSRVPPLGRDGLSTTRWTSVIHSTYYTASTDESRQRGASISRLAGRMPRYTRPVSAASAIAAVRGREPASAACPASPRIDRSRAVPGR